MSQSKPDIKNFDIVNSVAFGSILAIVGGFLDSYTFVTRGGIFANAQTGNMILFSMELSKGQFKHSLNYLFPILAFILGVIVAESIKSHALARNLMKWKSIILLLELLILFIIGFIPSSFSKDIINITISFVASLQVSTFKKLVDTPYATTITTGNLRTATHLFYNAIKLRNKSYLERALRFSKVILCFFSGGILGAVSSNILGVKSIWICSAILLGLFIAAIANIKKLNRLLNIINK